MPKRMIDGERTWRSKKLRQVQPEAYRAEYPWLFPIANDVATFECDAESIWAICYATARPSVSLDDVVKILDEFERVRLLFRWQVGGQTWGYWTGTDKPGLLPKPSERYSKDPQPPQQELARFMGGSPAGDPREPATGFGFGTGFGLGSGIGVGSGNGSTVAGGSVATNQPPIQNPNGSRFGISNNPTLTTVAALQHLQFMTGDVVAANDPIVPFLTNMAEEFLSAHAEQPLTLYNVRTQTERVVNPGDPDYPGPDGCCIEADDQPGLSLRESATVRAFAAYAFACEILVGLRQHITVEDSEDPVRTVLQMMGWPQSADYSTAYVHAVAHWAYKTSDYWKEDGRLTTVPKFCASFTTLRAQYDKYYARLPEGKKPHDVGVGRPERNEETVR